MASGDVVATGCVWPEVSAITCPASAFYSLALVKTLFCNNGLLRHHLGEHHDIPQVPPPSLLPSLQEGL